MSQPQPNPVRRRIVGAAGALLAARRAPADERYPSRPITLVVPFAPGGIADLTARTVAQALAHELRQPIVVDNRPSAGSIVGTAAVAQARPDGYTLLLMSNGNAVSASLFRKLPFDIGRDFAPVSTLGFFDLVILAGAGSRHGHVSLAQVLDDARRRPGNLTIGTIAPGSTQNLAAELFKSAAGIEALVVPYRTSPAVVTALRAGDVDIAFEILGPMLGQINAGAVRPLAVTAPARHAALPAVPAVRELAGLGDYTVASWNALAAPARTPAAVIERLAAGARAALASMTVRGRLESLGVRPQAGSPAELQALLESEIARWRTVIAAARIELQ